MCGKISTHSLYHCLQIVGYAVVLITKNNISNLFLVPGIAFIWSLMTASLSSEMTSLLSVKQLQL